MLYLLNTLLTLFTHNNPKFELRRIWRSPILHNILTYHNTRDIGHLLQLVFHRIRNLAIKHIQGVLEAEWCGLKGSIFYSLYDFHSKTFLILIDLFCIIGILPVDTWERLCRNRVRSLLSMRCVLPGYSFESNIPALGTAGSVMTIKSL